MAQRITRSMVDGQFRQFVAAIGGTVSDSSRYPTVGDFVLDTYDGYIVDQIKNVGGGTRAPFGLTRRSAREMYECLSFAVDTLYYMEGRK